MLSINRICLDDMRRIHDDSFPLPDLSNPANIAFRSIIGDGKLIAIGIVRYTTEGILIADEELPVTTRARATEMIVKELAEEVKARGLYECHVFVKDLRVKAFLKHLGFIDCNAGDPLVIML